LPVLFVCFRMVSSLLDDFPRARRDGMLELLALSGLNPLHLWWLKAGTALYLACINLSALLPSMLIFIVTGHLKFATLITYLLLTLILLWHVLSLTQLASIRTSEQGMTIAVFVLIGVTSLFLPSCGLWLEKLLSSSWLGDRWLLLGPFYGYAQALNLSQVKPGDLPLVFSGLLFWTLLFLFLAWRLFDYKVITTTYQKNPSHRHSLARLAHTLCGWNSSSAQANPLTHLITRDAKTTMLTWFLTLGVVLCVLGIVLLRGITWFKPIDFIFIGIFLLLAFYALVSSSAEKVMADARREGLLELVLTSPLTPKDFVHHLEAGILQLYRRLYWVLVGLFSLLAIAGGQLRSFNIQAIISYALIWAWIFYGLHGAYFRPKTRSLWVALNLGRPNYSVAQMWLPSFSMITYLAVDMLLSRQRSSYDFFSQFPWGNGIETFTIVFISFILLPLTSITYDDFTEETLLTHFREVATHPLPDPGDERIAKWDRAKIFPTPKDT
jgi:hypothetical protein